MHRTFGPSGYIDRDDAVRLSCRTRSTFCFLLYGSDSCHDTRPPRPIEDTRVTPDWCKYAAGMAKEIREMADFNRMGLSGLTRAELLPLMRAVPPELRAFDPVRKKPFGLNEHNAGMMRAAIRKARLAEIERLHLTAAEREG